MEEEKDQPQQDPNLAQRRFGGIHWSARSCDLTSVDYFLWGAVKERCYTNDPQRIDVLKEHIRRAIDEIDQQTIENVLQNRVKRMDYFQASRGRHLTEIVFHK
ncbi:unnamed protein product [Acanthoscelides obtectus]|uniref:Uncharacterized protein n=1 Tax=Acanthoscelides obtectus TaxID=200917 RepID=A0A9P0L1S0_ACAOB|nr:unnamed protein product [Acanthoscelides obtectus]CAK1619850.1 hypothetical protein AOBTE_LOCUS26 [Acanthoscelides obtectus]